MGLGSRLESGGAWLEALAAGAVSLTEALRNLPPRLRRGWHVRTARRRLRREAVREARRKASELPERLLPRPDRLKEDAPAQAAPAVPESARGPAETTAAESASQPDDPVVETALPASTVQPARDPEPQAESPRALTQPPPASRSRQRASPPPAAPEPTRTLRSRAFDELPYHVAGAVVSLRGRKRPRKEHVREVILLLLESGERRSAADLADWVGISQETLTRRHLAPLVDTGQIEREFPNRITHPAQTYRAVRSGNPEAG